MKSGEKVVKRQSDNFSEKSTNKKLNQSEEEISNPTSWDLTDKTGMVLSGFVKIDNLTIRKILSDFGTFSITVAMLYILLLSHRNTQTNKCYPTMDVLASELNKNRTTVYRCLKVLEEQGYIHVITGNSKAANEYYFPQEDFFDESQYKQAKLSIPIPKSTTTRHSGFVSKPDTEVKKTKNKLAKEKIVSEEDDGFEF